MVNLSIVLITYNRSEFLDRTLGRIANSPFSACEIWVLNNASTDSTLDVCAKWGIRLPGMQVVTHQFNIGANANILRAYEYGTRMYKWILCDDDELHFEHISDLVKELELAQFDIFRVSDVGVLRGEEGTVSSLGDLLHNQEGIAFWSFGFVPGVIFRSAPIGPNVRYGYYGLHTWYPQLFVLLRSFGLDTIVYTTLKPALVRGSAPTGIGSEIFVYWLKSLDALPDQESKNAAFKCIFRGGPFKLGRSLINYVRWGSSPREVWSVWKQVLRLAPTRSGKLTVLVNMPLVLFPMLMIDVLYPIVKGKRYVVSGPGHPAKLRDN